MLIDQRAGNTVVPEPPLPREAGREQRKWQRRNVNLRCSLSCKGETLRAQILNISAGGALVCGVDHFPRGAPVRIAVDFNRTLQATVAWATSGSTGLKFDTPLQPADPLLINAI